MSDKFMVFSDLHLHPHGYNWNRVDDGLKVLDWIMELCDQNEVRTVFFLGDFFHTRDKLHTLVISKAIKKLNEFKEKGIDLILLVGNHDQPLKNSIQHHNLVMFTSLFKIVDSVCVWEGDNVNIFLVPYIESTSKTQGVLKELTKRKSNRKTNMLFGHFDILSARTSPQYISPIGLNPTDLSNNWDYVISGHYHHYQKIRDNIWYVGSPMQHNFGESGQTKGVIMYDSGDFKFFENTFSPRFIDVKDDTFQSDFVKGNFVRLFISDMSRIDEYRKKILSAGALEVLDIRTQAEVENTIFEKKWDSRKDILALASEWVDKSEVPINKDKLKEIGLNIIKTISETSVK